MPRRIKVTGVTQLAASTMAMALAGAPMPVAMTETGMFLIGAGIGEELPVFAAHIHPVEPAGDPPGPVRVAAGQDIGGELPGGAVEVIKPALGIFGNGTG